MTKEEFENFIKDKGYTIFLSLFYIFGLMCVFLSFEKTFAVVIFILLSCLIWFFNFGFRRSLILCLIFLLGVLRANQSSDFEKFFDNLNAKDVILKGQIVSYKEINNKSEKIKFYADIKEGCFQNKKFSNLNSKILINLDLDDNLKNKIKIGDYFTAKGILKSPKEATNPYQFDYKNYLLTKNCTNILYVRNNDFKITAKPVFLKNFKDSRYYILQDFENIRNKIVQKHSENLKSPKLELLMGLVFGDSAVSVDDKIQNDFKSSGLLHLLCASGLNVALIFGIWSYIANFIKLPYRFSILTGALFVILYTFMTGFPPSILRASLMLLFVLFGKLIDRSVSSIALIFFVGFLILLFSPKMIFDIGFQLSFMVTLGLICSTGVICEKFSQKDKKFKEKYKNISRVKKYFLFMFSPMNIAVVISVPIIAQAWVIPLQLYYFNNIAPLSVIANIAVVPFIGILSFVGFIGSILSFIPKISDFSVYIFDLTANPFLTLLIKISAYFASFKYSLIEIAGFNVFQMFGFWVLILLLILNIKKNFNKKYFYTFIFVLIVFLISFINFDKFNHNLEIIAFDVKNADSFLIKTPKNKYILIDSAKAGYKSLDDGKIIINPYLRNKRIKTIDYFIITHFDSDHCGGTISILDNFKVKNIIIQKDTSDTYTSLKILNYLKTNKLNYKIAKNNEIIYFEDDLKIKTVIPKVKNITDNSSSVVTYLTYKDKKLLFSADSGVEGFSSIKNYTDKNIDIFKIGHHGAQNTVNSAMIDYFNPKYTLISSGFGKFEHPHHTTLDILRNSKTKIVATKYLGFIKFVLKENEFEVYNYNSKTKKLERVDFLNDEKLPFNKTEYFQNFVKQHI